MKIEGEVRGRESNIGSSRRVVCHEGWKVGSLVNRQSLVNKIFNLSAYSIATIMPKLGMMSVCVAYVESRIVTSEKFVVVGVVEETDTGRDI